MDGFNPGVPMLQLCRECRRAFNLNEAEYSQPVGQTSHTKGPCDGQDVAASTVATEVCDAADTRVQQLQGSKLVGEGSKLVREGSKLVDELIDEGSKLIDEGSKLVGEGSNLFGDEVSVDDAPASKRQRVKENSPPSTDTGASMSELVTDGNGETEDGMEARASCTSEGTSSDLTVKTRERKSELTGEKSFASNESREGVDITASVSPICSGCLGLLDDSFADRLAYDISTELEQANYEHVETFCLSISTPLSLIIRRCGVLFYLRENFDIMDELTPPHEAYVKEGLRYKLYAKLKSRLDSLTSDVESPFQIIVKLDHSHSDMECRLASETWPNAFDMPRKKRRKWSKWKKRSAEPIYNTASVTKAMSYANAEDFENGDFFSVTQPCTYTIELNHAPLFVGGRYCKYSRDLPQTPWFIGGVRKAETSIQELICNRIQELTRSSGVKFSSSGREDCDVRMLGNGRPFRVELLNPRKMSLNKSEIELLQADINSDTDLVEVKRLQVMSKASAAFLKEGEMEKRKEYRALVWAPEKLTQESLDTLSAMEDLVVHQKTPIRVLHRRALATRDRTIHKMSAELVNDQHFYLKLTTQAGTYIKEFVHGDFGRTRPNLRSLMRQEVDILTLDVCEVLLEWPPPLK